MRRATKPVCLFSIILEQLERMDGMDGISNNAEAEPDAETETENQNLCMPSVQVGQVSCKRYVAAKTLTKISLESSTTTTRRRRKSQTQTENKQQK